MIWIFFWREGGVRPYAPLWIRPWYKTDVHMYKYAIHGFVIDLRFCNNLGYLINPKSSFLVSVLRLVLSPLGSKTIWYFPPRGMTAKFMKGHMNIERGLVDLIWIGPLQCDKSNNDYSRDLLLRRVILTIEVLYGLLKIVRYNHNKRRKAWLQKYLGKSFSIKYIWIKIFNINIFF